MVQNSIDPRRLNPLLALLVIAVLVAHAAGLVAPWGSEAPLRVTGSAQTAAGMEPSALVQIAEAQRLVRVMRAQIVAAATASDADASRRNIEQATAVLADSARVVRDLTAREDTPRDSLTAQLALTQGQLAASAVLPVAAALKSGNSDAARRILLEQSLSRLAAHEEVLQAIFAQHHERMDAAYRLAAAAAARAQVVLILVCLLATAAVAAHAWYVRRRIIGPVALLGHVMRVVSADHNHTHRAHVYGHPAVVRLAGAFNDMMSSVQAAYPRDAGAGPAAAIAVVQDAVQGTAPADTPAQCRAA
jgi:hypothetical protein